MSARSLLVAPAVALLLLGGGGLGVVACKQILGVQDLGVVDGGGEGQAGAQCHGLASTEACYTCCAFIDGGDLTFFSGDLHQCVCQTECSADCPIYCGPSAAGDTIDCDLCVYLSVVPFSGPCQQRAAAAGASTPGSSLIEQCLQGCSAPSDVECAGVSTLRGCYDCCEGKHPAAQAAFFGATAQACVCGAGCAGVCPNYCPNNGTDVGVCTQCALASLLDGGCASTGAGLCTGSDCAAMTACMQQCAQPQ